MNLTTIFGKIVVMLNQMMIVVEKIMSDNANSNQ